MKEIEPENRSSSDLHMWIKTFIFGTFSSRYMRMYCLAEFLTTISGIKLFYTNTKYTMY